MSGMTFGFTGSYIFSQTIFTYRTGSHSRWIGFMIMVAFAYIICSPVNVLQVSPLFFLGSTLIFIGYDLLYEWLWEIRHQVFLSEYGIVWFTFIIIQVVGIDAGIILGVLIAILDQVVVTAKTSSINRVAKTSRAVWTPADAKILHDHAYNPSGPKIVTLEVIGTVFFGSSLNILTRIEDEIGLREDEHPVASPINTPHTSSQLLTADRKLSSVGGDNQRRSQTKRGSPKYLVLDLMAVSHLDASATRGCFLQLVKMCAKRDILVCASGVTPRIEWMFRSHDVSISTEEEEGAVIARLLSRQNFHKPSSLENILLFVTVQEALEFCETALIHRFDLRKASPSLARISDLTEQSLARVLNHILGASEEEKEALRRLDNHRYHEEKEFSSGDMIFQKNTHADAFYIVLQGSIAKATTTDTASDRQNQPVVSGAGLIQNQRSASSNSLFDSGFQERSDKKTTSVATLWHPGSVFGYLGKSVEDVYGKTSLTESLTLVSGSFQTTCWSNQENVELWRLWMERKWLNLRILILIFCRQRTLFSTE
jgi:anti-anti-sigma regulatory factor/CRP-like cAMP-binding protein